MKKLEVKKSKINGKGLFAAKEYNRGQFIEYIHGSKVLIRKFNKKIYKKTFNWIAVSRFTFINTDESVFRFINHSCEPNAAIKGERTVYALRPIKCGEEVTIDYSLNEVDPDFLMSDCHCGSKFCRKNIGPIVSLSSAEYKRKEFYISDRFKRVYLRTV